MRGPILQTREAPSFSALQSGDTGWGAASSFSSPHRAELLDVLPVSEPRCPAGKVEARPCTPWNDRECVDRESGTQASGKTLVPGVTTSLEPPVTLSPSSGSSQLGIIAAIVGSLVLLLLLLLAGLYRCWRTAQRTHQGEVGGGGGHMLCSLLPPSLPALILWTAKPFLPSPTSAGSLWPGSAHVLWAHPPSPASPAPLQGRDRIRPPFLGLKVASSPSQALGGQPLAKAER